MPSALSPDHDTTHDDRALVPLIDASMNIHAGTPFLNFARVLFGTAAADAALAVRRAEYAEMGMMANGADGEAGACRSLMRAWFFLQRRMGESDNAQELYDLAVQQYTRVQVEADRDVVIYEAQMYGF